MELESRVTKLSTRAGTSDIFTVVLLDSMNKQECSWNKNMNDELLSFGTSLLFYQIFKNWQRLIYTVPYSMVLYCDYSIAFKIYNVVIQTYRCFDKV